MAIYIAKRHNDVTEAIRRTVHYFKDRLDFKKGFFLKPNIVFPVKEKTGEITRHEVVRGLVQVLREIDADTDIVMAEGTAAGTDPHENFRVSGYLKLAAELGVTLHNLDEAERITVDWKYGRLRLPKMAFDRTYINLPILKPSSAALFSGAMKNQKGLLEPKVKKGFHKLGLHEPISFLNKAIQPDLTIMDGINFFKEVPLISGANTYEIDRFAADLLGVPDPDYLKTAKRIGLGDDGFSLVGDYQRQLTLTLTCAAKEYKKFFRLRLWANPRACSMCRFVFLNLKRFSSNDLVYSTIMKLKLLKYALTGAEILFGSKPNFRLNHKRVICFGDCTRKLAERNGYIHVPGCPPTKKQVFKHI